MGLKSRGSRLQSHKPQRTNLNSPNEGGCGALRRTQNGLDFSLSESPEGRTPTTKLSEKGASRRTPTVK